MMAGDTPPETAIVAPAWRWAVVGLVAMVGLALLFGGYGRFTGLGLWPFGVDEFYISRSIDHILNVGVPRFPCGGYYTRGISYQYLVALARLSGLSPEFGARLISAGWSLTALPAAYLIGRRLHGRVLGLMMVIVLSASVWEIELARFARMYAPFQSVFLWYTVFFLRYTVDRNRRALVPMVALSVLGVLTWEGGALLGVANLLPPLIIHREGRLKRPDWLYLAAMLPLCALLWLAATDLRGLGLPALAEGPGAPIPANTAPSSGAIDSSAPHFGWLLLAAIPAVLAIRSASWIWSLRRHRLAAAGLAAALASALLHQFVLCAGISVLLLLSGLLSDGHLAAGGARAFVGTLVSCAVFWLLFELWGHAAPTADRWVDLAQRLGGFPNVVGEFVRPWGRTMPLLTGGALTLMLVLTVLAVSKRDAIPAAARVVMILLVVMLLAVGARHPGRVETRYTFFLYPLVIALSLRAIIAVADLLIDDRRRALAMAALAGLVLFSLSEDFQPRHVVAISSREINFRLGMSDAQAAHFYPRADYRGAAQWLTQNAQPEDVVILGIPSLDPYYPKARYFFLQQDDDRFEAYACGAGDIERWTNLPLLHGSESLAAKAADGQRIILMMYPDQAQQLLADVSLRALRPQLAYVSPDNGVAAILLNTSR